MVLSGSCVRKISLSTRPDFRLGHILHQFTKLSTETRTIAASTWSNESLNTVTAEEMWISSLSSSKLLCVTLLTKIPEVREKLLRAKFRCHFPRFFRVISHFLAPSHLRHRRRISFPAKTASSSHKTFPSALPTAGYKNAGKILGDIAT